MKVNKYLPFAFIYFFLNTVGLPFGLTWMALLAPFFYIWVIIKRGKDILLPFLAILLPFVFFHLSAGNADVPVYLISLLNLIMVYIFCQAVYTFLLFQPAPGRLFRQLLVINFILCLIAIVCYFTPWLEVFWIRQQLTKGVDDFYRLKMLTYEASHYASLFIPLFFYFFLQYLLKRGSFPQWILFPMLFLPLILSFSMGVIASAVLAFGIQLLWYFRSFVFKRRVFNMLLNLFIVSALFLAVLFVFYRHSPLFTRLANIFSGEDTSANGRTVEAYYFARNMIGSDHALWGIGFGQIKLQGHDLIQGYYLYNMDFVATLPNSMAEILAILGWAGVILKLGIEIFLFFFTRVWRNYYRLLLFFYIFIYQFTGSFITNMAEYVIWILAFSTVFREFDVRNAENSPAGSFFARPSSAPIHNHQ